MAIGDVKEGMVFEVRARKAGNKVLRYEVHKYPFEDKDYGDQIIRSVLLSMLVNTKVAEFDAHIDMNGDPCAPSTARKLANAKAAELAAGAVNGEAKPLE